MTSYVLFLVLNLLWIYTVQIPTACAQMVEIDPEDTPFPALVLHPECPLWSNDTHMKRQSLVTCYSAGEIADLKENNDRHNDVRR